MDRRVQDITTWFVLEETLDDLNSILSFLCDYGLVPNGAPAYSRQTTPPNAVHLYLQSVVAFDPHRYNKPELVALVALSQA